MNTITSIIIDDEEHNRNVLKTLLQKYCPNIHVISEASNADDAYILIDKLKPQLIFLDIKMPKKSGFDLLKMFDKIDFEVIFVSAFNEYAITAFEFNALGYILKPIDYAKLIVVVDKAVNIIKSDLKNNDVFYFVKTVEDKNDLINKITVHHGGKVVFLIINDIVAIETNKENCEIIMSDSSRYFSSKDLKMFESMFSRFNFFTRIDKSTLINLNFISSYSKGENCIIRMTNGLTYEAARRKKGEVLEKLKLLKS